MILGAAVVVGVLIVVDAGVSDSDIVCGKRRGNSSQTVLLQWKGKSFSAKVALGVL